MALKNRDIDMGHARALLSLESPSAQLKLFKDAHRNGYSVRKIEEIVQRMKKGESLQEVKKLIESKAAAIGVQHPERPSLGVVQDKGKYNLLTPD